MSVKPIPEGQHRITAYMGITNASAAIDFYIRAFGAEELFRLDGPGGRVGHAELRIGDSRLMLADPCDQAPFGNSAGSAIAMHLYVEDVDAQFAQAIEAGGEVVNAVQDQFYGDRSGSLRDPFGILWFVATHKEDLSPEEIRRRAAQMFAGGGAGGGEAG